MKIIGQMLRSSIVLPLASVTVQTCAWQSLGLRRARGEEDELVSASCAICGGVCTMAFDGMIVTSAGNEIVNVMADAGVGGVCAPAAHPATPTHNRTIAISGARFLNFNTISSARTR